MAHLIIMANEAGINLRFARAIFESNVTSAQEDCITRLDPSKGHLLEILCNDAIEKAAERFKDILSGTGPAVPSAPLAAGCSGDHVLATPKEADPEVPKAIKAIKLQHDLPVLFDQDGHDHLLAHFDAQPHSEGDFYASQRSTR